MTEMNLDLYAVSPTDTDLEGVLNLCKLMWKHRDVDAMDLSRLLIEQNYVTTILKDEEEPELDEEDTVYALASAINLRAKKDRTCVKQIIKFILKSAEPDVTGDTFKQIFDFDNKNSVPALIIKEKIRNIPETSVVPLWKQLINDMEQATKDGMPYDFTHYIVIVPVILVAQPEKKVYFVDETDDMFASHSMACVVVEYPPDKDMNVVFSDEKNQSCNGTMKQHIYVLSKEQFEACWNQLKNETGSAQVLGQAAATGLAM